MDYVSDSDWLGSLDATARDRFDRTVRELAERDVDEADVRRRVRADMEQRHAPLAFGTLLDTVAPRSNLLGGKLSMSTLLSGSYIEADEHAGAIDRANRALDRLAALGASYADLEALLHVAQLSAVDNFSYWLLQGAVSTDLPGWRLVEKWDGKETGRPLSC